MRDLIVALLAITLCFQSLTIHYINKTLKEQDKAIAVLIKADMVIFDHLLPGKDPIATDKALIPSHDPKTHKALKPTHPEDVDVM